MELLTNFLAALGGSLAVFLVFAFVLYLYFRGTE